jgi:UDP-N-acetylmuramoylalanine-D-glutamate ligase
LDFTAKKVLVVGAGISGRAAIKVLLSRGADITVCDKKDHNEIVRILHTELADKVTVCSSWSDLDVNALTCLL